MAPPLLGSVTAQILPLQIGVAGLHGVSAQEVIERFEIPPEWLSDPEARVPLARIIEIWDELPVMCGAPDFGLTIGSLMHQADFVLRLVVAGSATVRIACERVLRMERFINDLPGIPPVTQEEEGGVATLVHPDPRLPRHAADMLVATWASYLRHFAGSSDVRGVWLRAARPADVSRHVEVLGVEPVFDADRTAIAFPAEVLDRPNLLYSRVSEAMIEPWVEQALKKLPPEDALGEVRAAIARRLEDGVPKLDEVARALATSTRSLQRRLREVDTTYSAVLDQVREQRARERIADRTLPLFAVALDSGFSDQSSFTRAFQRWTGMTPGQYRRHGRE